MSDLDPSVVAPAQMAAAAAPSAKPDLAALEQRIAALEGGNRSVLARLHDKFVGYRTVIFGTLVGVGPAIADYFGQVDWKAYGLAPLTALIIGGLIVGFRAITTTPLGGRKA